jgi:hypothetical protein
MLAAPEVTAQTSGRGKFLRIFVTFAARLERLFITKDTKDTKNS